MCVCIYIQKFFKVAVLPHMALQHVREAFPDMYSSPILPHIYFAFPFILQKNCLSIEL